jgi:hypothetical protein
MVYYYGGIQRPRRVPNCVAALSPVNALEYLKERDGIVAEGLDNHRDQEAVLVLSQWLMRWNISRGVMVLSPQVSIESNEPV